MVVTKTVYSRYATLVGTLAEVVKQLSDDGIPNAKIVSIYYDVTVTKHVAVYSVV